MQKSWGLGDGSTLDSSHLEGFWSKPGIESLNMAAEAAGADGWWLRLEECQRLRNSETREDRSCGAEAKDG